MMNKNPKALESSPLFQMITEVTACISLHPISNYFFGETINTIIEQCPRASSVKLP